MHIHILPGSFTPEEVRHFESGYRDSAIDTTIFSLMVYAIHQTFAFALRCGLRSPCLGRWNNFAGGLVYGLRGVKLLSGNLLPGHGIRGTDLLGVFFGFRQHS